MNRTYYIYIMVNEFGNVMYVGVTNNLERRVYEHKMKIIKGFTAKYNVNKLVYFEQTDSIETVILREKEIKKWRREKKDNLVKNINPNWDDLAEQLGRFLRRYRFFEMTEGTLEIREATPSDIPELARIHLASKIAAESGIVDQAFLDAKTQEEYEEKWIGFLAAEDSQKYIGFKDDEAVGFISFGRLRTPPPGTSKIRPLYSSEIFAIYVDPEHFQQGYGASLLKFAVEKLKEQKHQSLCLWALKDNKRACSFYDAMGGQRIGKQIVKMGPTKVKEVCYAWRDISIILNR